MVGSVNGHARTEQVGKQIKQKVGKQAVSADRALHDEVDVLIVGAGISGIGMAVHLQKQCPGKSFALVDRRANLGGTWDLFRYPGIRSDSDMHTLGFVFEPWREQKAIADGPSILKYLNKVVDDHALRDHIAYSRTVVAADWDTLSARWSVTLKDESKEGKGHISTIKARFLYMGSGYYDYDQGHKVDFAGSEDFKGDIIHPQFWPKDYDYSGKKIVVIGSGATAVTLVPALTDKAAHVTMLQRTPTWYFIRPAKDALANFLRRILPDKWAYAITRFKNIHMQSFTFKRARAKPDKAKQVLSKKIKDDLGSKYDAAAFTPPYAPWEQRLCLVPDSDFFKAIVADKAEVVTDHVDHIDAVGIQLKSGKHLDADIIVTATGLKLAMAGKVAFSVDGKDIHWHEQFYYKGCMFSNIPNMAVVFGYLNASWTLKADIVSDYICRLLNHMGHIGADIANPLLTQEKDEEGELFDFSSGYIQRALDILPRNGAAAPWRLSQDYLQDKIVMKDHPIDDGVLRFSRAPNRAKCDDDRTPASETAMESTL